MPDLIGHLKSPSSLAVASILRQARPFSSFPISLIPVMPDSIFHVMPGPDRASI